jgi:hypothetical protein
LSDNGPSEHFNVTIQDGELAIQKFAPDFEGLYAAYVPGTYADAAMALDVHGMTDEYGPLAFLWCRRSALGSYRFAVDPSDGTARLSRVRADGDLELLADWTEAPSFNLGSGSNHIEVLCRGSLVELRINQAPVISVHDTQVTEGSMSFGVGSFTDSDVVAEFRFANFVLTQR